MKGLPLSFFVFPPLCLFVAFSLNIIVVFLSCPGSRYCLTKYFMVHSTLYLPTASYLLSKRKGSAFRGEGKKKKIAGLSYCFYFQVSRRDPVRGNTGNRREERPFICRGTHGWPLIYLFAAYLFSCHTLFLYDSRHLFLGGFPSYLFKREKFKAALSAEGEACGILTLQRP